MPTLGWLLLVLAVAAVAWVALRRRRPVAPPRAVGSDDLTSLGLSEVRPAGSGPAPDAPTPGAERSPGPTPASLARAEPGRSEPPRREPAPPAARPAAPRQAGPAVAADAALWPGDPDPARHLLASLAAHAGGPAGVLRYDPDADAYVVEALAGGAGPLPDPVPAGRCPLHDVPQDGGTVVLDAAGGFGPFAGSVVACALAAPPARRAFLVVAPRDGARDAVAEHVGRYADLLAGLSDLRADDASPPAAPPPRASVIRAEQEAAQAEGRPLAFALVTLAEAEDVLAREDPAEVADAERRLHRRLGEHPAVRRTEPFGDLLVGVFLDLEPDGVAAWCRETSAGDPALFIGAVAPVDADAADVRAAAASALHDAYDQQRAQVVAG